MGAAATTVIHGGSNLRWPSGHKNQSLPTPINLNRAGGKGKPYRLKHVFLLSGHVLAMTPTGPRAGRMGWRPGGRETSSPLSSVWSLVWGFGESWGVAAQARATSLHPSYERQNMSPQGIGSKLCWADSLHRNPGRPERTVHSWSVGEQTSHCHMCPEAAPPEALEFGLLCLKRGPTKYQSSLNTWALILSRYMCGCAYRLGKW